MSYPKILQTLRTDDARIHGAYRCGSRVYGTATPASDHDYVVVLADPDARRDLEFGPGINVTVHGRQSFQRALDEHTMFALEALFAPAAHRLKDGGGYTFRLDPAKLRDTVIERSDADFAKAARRFEDEPAASKKRLFHALRLPVFALQIAQRGRLEDFAAANAFWTALTALEATEWPPYRAQFEPAYARLCAELRTATARKPRRQQ